MTGVATVNMGFRAEQTVCCGMLAMWSRETVSLDLADQMRPGSGSQGTAAGCITPLPLLKSTDSPCVLICTVACNVCAFHFNLPCHFSPGADFEEREISILNSSAAQGLLFYFPALLPPSCHPIFLSSREEGTGARPSPLFPHSNAAHSECVVQQE